MTSFLCRFLQPAGAVYGRKWLLPSTWKNVARCASMFTLSETQEMLLKTCRDFADNELIPIAGELDEKRQYPKEQVVYSTNKLVSYKYH